MGVLVENTLGTALAESGTFTATATGFNYYGTGWIAWTPASTGGGQIVFSEEGPISFYSNYSDASAGNNAFIDGYASSYGSPAPYEVPVSVTAGATIYIRYSHTGSGNFTISGSSSGAAGSGNASIAPNMVTVSASGGPTPERGNAALTAPMGVLLIGMGGSATLTAPSPALSSTGHDATGERAAYLTAPMQTLSAFGGAAAALTGPKQTLSVTGTFTNFGAAALTAPAPTLSAAGRTSGVGTAALQAPMSRAVGYSGAVLSVTIGSATLTATGTSGSVGRAILTAPLFDLTASATRQNSGSAILTAPVGRLATTGAAWLVAPGAQLTAIGSATITATYEAYALNLKHAQRRNNHVPTDELTHYTNYPFDRIVRYKNSYYGMNSTGLFLLEGTTDFAEPTPTPIAWSYKTSMMDFDSIKMKNVSMVYFGGRMAPEATVTVYAGETTPTPYSYVTPRDETAQNYRQPLGLGLRARYYAFGASGAGELTLDSISIDVAELARKV